MYQLVSSCLKIDPNLKQKKVEIFRHWREREFEKNLTPGAVRLGLGFWRALATRPRLYNLFTRCTALGLKLMAMGKGRLLWLPMGSGWTDHRDFPAPQGGTFQAKWKAKGRAGK